MSYHIYLDQITTSSAHLLSTTEEGGEDDEAWRRTLVQPVAIPDLDHVSVRTRLKNGQQNGQRSRSEEVMRPDGSVARELRDEIARRIRDLPQQQDPIVADADDMRERDGQRKREGRHKSFRRRRDRSRAPSSVSADDSESESRQLTTRKVSTTKA